MRGYLGTQLWKLGTVGILLAALFALGFRRRDRLSRAGGRAGAVLRERWLGFPRAEPWTSFGGKWLVFLSAGMVVILSLFGGLNFSALLAALPLLPLICARGP